MAASINASTTAGVVTTADTSGVLNIQTAGTTAISIDASQAVSFTNAPTVTGGTANGVAYLNGSKVLTTGSALVFDGTNLGIGTTSPSDTIGYGRALDIQSTTGAAIYLRDSDNPTTQYAAIAFDGNASVNNLNIINSSSTGPIRLFTNGAERARIDSSGNLLVGTTTFQANTPKLLVTTSSQGNGAKNTLWLNDSAATAVAALQVWSFSQTTAPSGAFVDAYYNGVNTLAFRIAGNGNVTNANNSYGSTSDIKLKENIVDASPKLNKLMQVRIRNYNLKGDYEQHKQIGVIAQELEAVFPSMVDETSDKDAEGNDLGTTTKSVKYSVFVPMLIKAMQEQQAIIQSLTARITALEGA